MKIFRTAKRVSGQLLTLIVFEVVEPAPPSPPVVEIEAAVAGGRGGGGGRISRGNADGVESEGGEGDNVVAVYDPFTAENENGEHGNQAVDTTQNEEDDDDYEYETDSEPDEADNSVMVSGDNTPPVPVYPPPVFRIVAYDPKSRRKLVLTVPKEALLEISGGSHSQYLAPER